MPLHLLKLCVDAESLGDLEDWIALRLRDAAPGMRDHVHVTRMVPKRRDELLSGGSLYWVIKGQIAARQTLRDIQSFTDDQGVGRCRIVMDTHVVPVLARPFRAFQGWRYLPTDAAPPDASTLGSGFADMPEALRQELRGLGLL